MKYRKHREHLEARRKAYDAIKDPKVKASTKRPGSMSGRKGSY